MNIDEILTRIRANIDFDAEPVYNCDICKDIQWVPKEIDGKVYEVECECQLERRRKEREERLLKKHLEESNLQYVFDKLTFDNYKTDNKGLEEIKKRALEYLDDNSWWVMGGNVGSGKTHITTAICGELMKKGKAVYYMNWKLESIKLKTSMTENSYQEKLNRLCSVEVLYIDDLLKGSISKADIDLLYMIIDARYTRDLQTLISSEKVFDELKNLDEAIQSRIFEKTKPKYWLEVKKLENYRRKK